MVIARQANRPYTAEDLLRMPDDGQRYEVIGGELIVSLSPSEIHQRLQSDLHFLIRNALEKSGWGVVYSAPFDVHLGEFNVLQPDVVVCTSPNSELIRSDGIHGAPDLIVEIVSPSSASIDRVRKAATYAMYGVREYWIVDPASATILAQELINGRYQSLVSKDGMVHSRIISELSVDRSALFARPDWLL